MIHRHSPGLTRHLTSDADQGLDAAKFAADLRFAAYRPEFRMFGNRHPHAPAPGLGPVMQAPQPPLPGASGCRPRDDQKPCRPYTPIHPQRRAPALQCPQRSENVPIQRRVQQTERWHSGARRSPRGRPVGTHWSTSDPSCFGFGSRRYRHRSSKVVAVSPALRPGSPTLGDSKTLLELGTSNSWGGTDCLSVLFTFLRKREPGFAPMRL